MDKFVLDLLEKETAIKKSIEKLDTMEDGWAIFACYGVLTEVRKELLGKDKEAIK